MQSAGQSESWEDRRKFVKLGIAGLAGAGAVALLNPISARAVTTPVGPVTNTVRKEGTNFISQDDSGNDVSSGPNFATVLQNAIDNLPAAGGTIILKKSLGTVPVNNTVFWRVNKPIVLLGEAWGVTLQPTVSPMFSLPGVGWSDSQGILACVWANFRIDCQFLPTAGRAIDGQYVFDFVFDHMELLNVPAGRRGISIVPGQIGSFRNIKANNGNGPADLIYLDTSGGNGSNMAFYDCAFGTSGPTSQGVNVGGFHISFHNCHFANTRVQVRDASSSINFENCMFESASTLPLINAQVVFIGCQFSGNVHDEFDAPKEVIYAGFGASLSMVGCKFGQTGSPLTGDCALRLSEGHISVDMVGCTAFVSPENGPYASGFFRDLIPPVGRDPNVVRQFSSRMEAAGSRLCNQGKFTSILPQLTYEIPHGLAASPDTDSGTILVTPGSADAKGDFYVTADQTKIYVTYAVAPASVNLRWYAQVL